MSAEFDCHNLVDNVMTENTPCSKSSKPVEENRITIQTIFTKFVIVHSNKPNQLHNCYTTTQNT